MKGITPYCKIEIMELLTFSEFLKITYPCLSAYPHKYKYVAYLCSLFVKGDFKKDLSDVPFSIRNYAQTDLGKIFRGKNRLPKKDALYINQHWNDSKFINRLNSIPWSKRSELYESLKSKNVLLGEDDQQNAEITSLYFSRIIRKLAGEVDVDAPDFCPIDLNGDYVNPEYCYYDSEKGVFYALDRSIYIPKVVAPSKISLGEEERPYIKALLEVFSEALGEECLTVRELEKEDQILYQELLRYRECFYSADNIRHVIRDAFVDGEKHFAEYKDELFEGIIEVHHQKFECGYDRLLAVMKESATMNLSKPKIERFYLIGGKERKGICHMLVEEGRIKTWVSRF